MSTTQEAQTSSAQLTSTAEIKEIAARKFTATLFLPELGARVRVRRVQRSTYVKAGRIPNSLLGIAAEASEESSDEGKVASFGRDELARLAKFKEAIVMDSVTSLKIVAEDPADDEIAISDIPDSDQDLIFEYAVNGTIPIALEGGESVTQSDLENFREERVVSAAGTDGGQVQAATE